MEIVGLKHVVQDDVNKRIAKFVGNQSKSAQILRNVFGCFEHFDCCDYLRSRMDEIYERRHAYAMNEYDKLMLIKSISSRRRKFEQLPQWIRKLLIIWRRKLQPISVSFNSKSTNSILMFNLQELNIIYVVLN